MVVTPSPLALLEAPQSTFPIPDKMVEWAIGAKLRMYHSAKQPSDRVVLSTLSERSE